MRQCILLGAPGSGKGTEAKKIAEKYQMMHISTGDLLRSSSDEEVKKIISTGAYISDEKMIKIVDEALKKAKNGWILDGFPRTIPQAEALEKILKTPPLVLFLDVSDDEIVKRLSLRRTCPTCQAIYHLESARPQSEGICDTCHSLLITRDDDKQEIVKHRLQIYREKTSPLIDYYQKKGLLTTIKATNKSPEQVFLEIKKLFD